MTPRELETYKWISAYLAEHATGPTYDEISAGIFSSGKSGVARIVKALIGQGYLDTDRLASGQPARRGLRLTGKPLPGNANHNLEWAIKVCQEAGYTVAPPNNESPSRSRWVYSSVKAPVLK